MDRYLLSEFFSRCTEHIVERANQYDAPELNLKRIADAWTNFLKREVHQDSLEDAAAYIALAELLKGTELEEAEENP